VTVVGARVDLHLAARLGVLDRVRDQVVDQLTQALGVSADPG
jgi:hypothetical protein